MESTVTDPAEFAETFVDAFTDWSFPPAELQAYQRLVAERKPYLICITPRSGSTYLGDLLRRTRSAGRPGEYLNLVGLGPALQKRRALGEVVETLLQYLAGVIERQAPTGGAVGIMTSFFQFQPLIETGLDRLLFSRFRRIRLYRKDLVRQAISLYLATETGLFHSHLPVNEDRCADPRNVCYDEEKIRGWIEHIWVQECGWENYLRPQRQPSPRIYYEALESAPIRVVRRILQSLELEMGHVPVPHRSKVKKIGDARNGEWACRFVSNADSLAFLRGLGIPDDRVTAVQPADPSVAPTATAVAHG